MKSILRYLKAASPAVWTLGGVVVLIKSYFWHKSCIAHLLIGIMQAVLLADVGLFFFFFFIDWLLQLWLSLFLFSVLQWRGLHWGC